MIINVFSFPDDNLPQIALSFHFYFLISQLTDEVVQINCYNEAASES